MFPQRREPVEGLIVELLNAIHTLQDGTKRQDVQHQEELRSLKDQLLILAREFTEYKQRTAILIQQHTDRAEQADLEKEMAQAVQRVAESRTFQAEKREAEANYQFGLVDEERQNLEYRCEELQHQRDRATARALDLEVEKSLNHRLCPEELWCDKCHMPGRRRDGSRWVCRDCGS